MSVSPARMAAFDILLRIESERAFSSILLPSYEETLSQLDRGLCHELVLGTLRRQIKLDRIIDVLAQGKTIDTEIRIALRLGLYQLQYLEKIPDHSAINESVELVKRAKKRSATGFVNAILRRATRETVDLVYTDDIDRICIETSHPRWLIEKWTADRGLDEAERIAIGNNEPPQIAFRVIGEGDDRTQQLISNAQASDAVEGCFTLDRNSRELLDLASEGRIYIQDEASQMTALAVSVPVNGAFLDVCAAPGGKTGLIASRNSPHLTVAGDLYQPRVEMLRENCDRQGVEASILRYDAEKPLPFAEGVFDAVLVDAPCTGTGTIRHHPEIRYFLRPEDVVDLSSKQRRILTNASKTVKQGGSLVYSTCSLEPEEGEAICEWFLQEHSAFRQTRPNVPERFLIDGHFGRTWSHRDGMDGFFIAAFERMA
ncbi:MAG TPA: 16S rRNA (cytosine(967)-C(5))-methyltransferase RsmB [Pyrinomonadaceae bacterium]|nr:16S rRNA (cytosine(967)-C(5))-methyltransferase RsmB [Pyrinomonadaceae bacterium]